MEQYLCHHFYEHPSISAVLACHLADNYIKPASNPASLVTTLEKTVKSLSTWVDKLETKKDKFTKEKKDKDQDHTS
jgi:hypothetical protein